LTILIGIKKKPRISGAFKRMRANDYFAGNNPVMKALSSSSSFISTSTLAFALSYF